MKIYRNIMPSIRERLTLQIYNRNNNGSDDDADDESDGDDDDRHLSS